MMAWRRTDETPLSKAGMTCVTRARCESQMALGSRGLNACWSYRRAVKFKFYYAWSSIAQPVCQRAFSLLTIWCMKPGVRVCIQQRKSTCLLWIWKTLASKLTTRRRMYASLGLSGLRERYCTTVPYDTLSWFLMWVFITATFNSPWWYL